jgi:chromosome segregation ATPase
MAEDDTTTDKQEPGPDWVPRSRFNELSNQMREMKAQLAEERRQREELQDADKPHVERLTKDLERAQKKIEEAEKRAADVESARQRDQKASWLTSAAAKHNFHDPDLAARMANLDDIEDAKTAERFVKDLAKEKTFLVKEEPKQPVLQKVGIAGTDQEAAENPGLMTGEQIQRQWGTELLRGIDPSAVQSE